LPSQRSQPQPEPNCFAVVSLNCFLKSSKLPKSFLICSPMAPVGSPPPLGFMIVQNMEWFTWPPPLLRTTVRTSSGTLFQIAEQVFGRVLAEVGVLLDGAVQIGDVGLVVLVVVQMHGFGVDVRFQSGVIIGKRWNFVCQSIPPCGR